LSSIVVQAPGGHILGRAVLHVDDDIAVPRPSVIAVILAGPSRMVGVRMIPADDFEALLARGFLGFKNILCSHRKTITRGVIAAIHERKKLQDLPRRRPSSPIAFKNSAGIAAKQRATAFMRIRLRAVR